MPVIDVQKEEEEARETKPKSYTWLAIIVLVVSSLTIGSIFGVIFLFSARYQSQIEILEDQIAALKIEETQKKKEAEEATEVSKKIAELDSVLEEHVCMTEVFKQLEKTTVKKVFFETLDLDTTQGGLSLEGKAASYRDVANQIAVWRSNDDFFKKINVAEVTFDEAVGDEVSYIVFSPEIELEKEKFFCHEEDLEEKSKNNNNL